MLFDLIHNVIRIANELSGGNQFVGGVVVASFSGAFMYLVKQCPVWIFRFVKSQFTTSMTFNNAGWEKKQTFIRLSEFIHNRCTEIGTRSLMVDSSYDWETGRAKMILTIGAGNHIFFYRGRPLLLNRAEHGNNQGETIKEVITLFKFGRSHELFKQLVDDNRPKDTDGLSISHWEKGAWQTINNVICGGLDSVALDTDIRTFFENEFTKFRDGADACRRLGIPHKLSMILHGRPGSGKTSLIRALAAHYGLNVCTLDLSTTSDKELLSAIGTIPRNTLLLLEDFDSAGQVAKREVDDAVNKGDISIQRAGSLFNVGTLSGVLNALDGVASLNNVVIMLTTNHLENVDGALCRPGRIDHIVDLPAPGVNAIKNHFERLYADISKYDVKWTELPGCIIHRIKQTSMEDTAKAAELLNHYAANPELAVAEQLGEIAHLERIREMRKQMALQEDEKAKKEAANAELQPVNTETKAA